VRRLAGTVRSRLFIGLLVAADGVLDEGRRRGEEFRDEGGGLGRLGSRRDVAGSPYIRIEGGKGSALFRRGALFGQGS
jgi:hypothetical protein